ncbi:hypothetical protein K449DRAFT_394314 [Hypoxylon sp. EC38]|nr:hypothetical protein K449DRAFT_394314 [Hypoxylon sp. EC38]
MGNRNTIKRRDCRRRKREREARQNDSSHQSEAQAKAPLINNWATYTTTPGFLSVADGIQENQRVRVQDTELLAEGSVSPVVKMEDFSDDIRLADIPQFGLPGARNPRFQNPVGAPLPAPVPVIPGKRTFQDVLSEHPEIQFGGLNREAIRSASMTIFDVTTEVIIAWLGKWCPQVDFASVFKDIENEDQQWNSAELPLLIVPAESMNIRPTGTTLANLYRKCRGAYDKYALPSPLEFAEIADHCLIICQVLKDEKCAEMINKVKTIVQWQHIGLDCMRISVLRDAAEEMERNSSFHPAAIESREEAILKFVTNAYGLHQFEYMTDMLRQVKELAEATYPALIGRTGPGILLQASNNNGPAPLSSSNQTGVSAATPGEVIVISDDEE